LLLVITRRTVLLAFGAGFVAIPGRTSAQPSTKVRRIGFLGARSRSTPASPDGAYDAFMQGLRELGYVEGRNLVIEWRFADGQYDRLPDLAAELVRLQVEVIVTHSVPATKAARKATSTIPIVTAAVINPIGEGLATSLARPGGNVTGLSLITDDVSPKNVELLKILVPGLSRIGFLMNPGHSGHPAYLKHVRAAAQVVGASVLPVSAATPEEIERGLDTMKQERAQAALVPSDTFFVQRKRQLAESALKRRMPSGFPFREFVEVGGLMSYGLNLNDFYRRAATFVDRILKGAKPGELPIEQPTKLELVINRNTSKALGLTIPQELLLRADEVLG
jgi:putative ABC transport system substrate-binding protein